MIALSLLSAAPYRGLPFVYLRAIRVSNGLLVWLGGTLKQATFEPETAWTTGCQNIQNMRRIP
jgi:hypothetical protein